MHEQLILVDENDKVLGAMDKLGVHRKGLLHRAFSVFIFNSKGQLLLQRRASGKYHSAGLWSNTCCSHPLFGERTDAAVKRRLYEEMRLCVDCSFRFSFIYKAELENNFTEHELDHVYFGYSDLEPEPDQNEVMDWRYISIRDLKDEIEKTPERFSYWLGSCLPRVIEHL